MTAPAIVARNLNIGYDGETVLRNINFDVQEGEVFAILGGSGSGKTTLLRALIGLLPPMSGTLEIFGEDLASAEPGRRQVLLRRMGVLFQTGALFADMTLAENVMLPIRVQTDLPESTARVLACIKLAQVGLCGDEELLPSQISGGMRKRAGIARAMALDPRILVLDEPSSGLDPVTASELDRLIRVLNTSLGITVVMVTHDMASALAVAGRCILIDRETRGIRAEGDPRELRDHHPDPRVRAFFRRAA